MLSSCLEIKPQSEADSKCSLAQALNIYIALLERRRLLASAQRQNSLDSPGPASSTVDADLEKVIQAIVPHVPMLATVLSTSSPSAVLVGCLQDSS